MENKNLVSWKIFDFMKFIEITLIYKYREGIIFKCYWEILQITLDPSKMEINKNSYWILEYMKIIELTLKKNPDPENTFKILDTH